MTGADEPTGAARGSRAQPFLGIPDPTDPEMVDGDALAGLVGRTFRSAWFRVDPAAREAFDRSTFLHQVYPDLTGDDIVEGCYLISLLDPIVSGLFRRRTGHDSVLLYGFDRIRFVSPVSESDPLRVTCSIVEGQPRGAAILVTHDLTLEVADRTRPAVKATMLALHPDDP